ncbi:MAG TPA: sensor histidine kinase [Anaerolineales bacterium]|nr:sensor histidine kinase [Anaerolineales bacterium]
MKQSTLEPGLLQTLRVYVVVVTLLLPFIWRSYSPTLGVEGSLQRLITPGMPVLVFLIVYLFFPWWQQRMGGAFLPVAFLLLAVQAVFGNYLTLQWLVPPSKQEAAALMLMMRAWSLIQFLVLFVAWQYNLFWMMVAGIGLSLLDTALYYPFLHDSPALYPFYSALVIGRFLSVTGAGLAFAWLIQRQREHRAALAEANHKLAQYAAATEQLAVSQERNRLARELHDTLAHSLSGAAVQLEAVQALWDVKPGEARQMLDQALEVTQNGLTEARRALHSLRASPLEDLGLVLAISDMAKSTAARSNLRLELEAQNHVENLSPEVEQCVYRIAQEAVANVARHAEATSLRVSLRHDSKALILTIADDGHGFDPYQVNDARYGLKGLRERAEMIGAALHVDSTMKSGTTIQLVLPLAEAGS